MVEDRTLVFDLFTRYVEPLSNTRVGACADPSAGYGIQNNVESELNLAGD